MLRAWERPKVSKLEEAFEAMKRRQEEFNLQMEVASFLRWFRGFGFDA